MSERLLADAVLVSHLLFIAFVVLGGLLGLRYRWVIALHLPAVAWGIFVETSGRLCPLTTLENSLRHAAGDAGYADSFVEHYVLPVIYPIGLTRDLQFVFAGLIIAINLAIYGWLLHSRRKNG
jgi:hypothetical protein